jgi:acyl-CoA hydrolase
MPATDVIADRLGAAEPGAAPRPAARSATTMTELVLPTHANSLGGVFGGQILSWIDLAAAICAQRHTGRIVVTAGIDDLSFERPIKVGQVAQITARMTAAFRTSVEVAVQVEGEDARTGERWPCVSAFVTFVAVDESLSPAQVPPLELASDEDRLLAAAAAERRAARLSRRPSRG